jgi:hypothetical protein
MSDETPEPIKWIPPPEPPTVPNLGSLLKGLLSWAPVSLSETHAPMSEAMLAAYAALVEQSSGGGPMFWGIDWGFAPADPEAWMRAGPIVLPPLAEIDWSVVAPVT